ncbi:MAG: TetR/AcrR family transcriptional regulator [Pseudonocardia sp.]|nr:TetR/AcrR family transcriptional regulator [Pseudonocardia sp.]
MNRPPVRPGAGTGRRDILEAAATAFTRSGYASNSMDDIADLLGATKGRLYHYYRAKADIFLDVVLTGTDELIAGIEPIATVEDVPIRGWPPSPCSAH